MKYGITYKGSKSKIAEELLSVLPFGNRLVDLFGGGFAITHCAILKYGWKWNKFLYNDSNPLLVQMVSKAVKGGYSFEHFHPKWVGYEDFNHEKDSDGYVKYMWSFGGNGNDYTYGHAIESVKEAVFRYIVDGTQSDYVGGVTLNTTSINDRRLEWGKKAKAVHKCNRIQSLESLNSLQRLESVKPYINRLEFSCMDYREYNYQEGDIVYCDIPYADSVNKRTDYGGGFSQSDFFEWASAQPYTVYFSSYANGDVLWQKHVRSSMSRQNNSVKRTETLFAL